MTIKSTSRQLGGKRLRFSFFNRGRVMVKISFMLCDWFLLSGPSHARPRGEG